MTRIRRALALSGTLLFLTACGGGADETSQASSISTSTTTSSSSASSTSSPTTPSSTTPSSSTTDTSSPTAALDDRAVPDEPRTQVFEVGEWGDHVPNATNAPAYRVRVVSIEGSTIVVEMSPSRAYARIPSMFEFAGIAAGHAPDDRRRYRACNSGDIDKMGGGRTMAEGVSTLTLTDCNGADESAEIIGARWEHQDSVGAPGPLSKMYWFAP